MPFQTLLPLAGVSPETVDQLLSDPSRARDLIIDSIPELLAHIAGRVAALKTLEGTLLSMMLTQIAKLFDVPESLGQRTGASRDAAIDQIGLLRPIQS